MTLDPEANRFLRAAVKTGLRLQRNEIAGGGGKGAGSNLQTLQRIKASLRKKRTSKPKTTCD